MSGAIAVDRIDELERTIEALNSRIDILVEEAIEQRRRRVALDELRTDFAPIAMSAVERTADVLDGHDIDTAHLIELAARIAANATLLEAVLDQIESLTDLARDMQPVVGRSMEMAIAASARFEERGYFEFADATAGVVDRIVTNYTADDVEALGDNVVQILDIVKDLTQPEVLAVAQRALDAVHRQTAAAESSTVEPPSLVGLARKLRDPEVRRGMGRALDTLAAVSAADERTTTGETAPARTTDTHGGA